MFQRSNHSERKSPMIILYNTMLSNEILNTDSNYVYLRQSLNAILEKRPNWVFLLPWPTGTKYKYFNDGFFTKWKDNIVRFPKRWQDGKYRAGCDYDLDWWVDLVTKYPIQIVWNNTIEHTPLFLNIRVQQSETWVYQILNFHHFPVHKTLPGVGEQYYGVQGLQALGTALADWNIFNSKHCRSMAMEVAAEFVNTARLNEIGRNHSIVYLGPIEEDFPIAQQETPRILYNHRLAGYKNYETTFSVLDQLWKDGLRFEVYVTTVDNYIGEIKNKPYAKIFNAVNRTDYLKLLAETNINTSNSQHETFCISMVESMAAQHCCIANNRVTFPELMENGKSGFIFNSETEQKELLAKAIQSKEFRLSVGQEARKRAYEKFSASVYADQAIDLIEKHKQKMWDRWPKSAKADELKAAIQQEKCPQEMMPFYRNIQRKMGWMNQAFPLLYFSMALEKYGKKIKFINSKPWVANA